MIFVGEKEAFIVRVLMNKAKEAGAECEFVRWEVDEINTRIGGVSLVVLFMEDGERPHESVLHFLIEQMQEKNLQIILIGEQYDVDTLRDQIPRDLIYESFCRPVDNVVFSKTVKEFLTKVASGEFRKSILIVDDDPTYLITVREWLKEEYKVSMANSGLQAIKWLAKNKVDLILLDYEMPITSGAQVLEMLRNEEETRSIPVMFLTGKGDKESVMAVVALRPEGYLLKNVKKEELREKLKEFFVLHK